MHITVEEALRIGVLARAQCIAGHGGLGRLIRSVTIMDAPDVERWLRGGELLLANAYVMKDSREAQIGLIGDLVRRDVACLAIKLHRYVEELPPEMLEIADRENLPVIQVPTNVPWTEITGPVLSAIHARSLGMLEYSRGVHERFTSLALGGGDIAGISDALQSLLGRDVIITRQRTVSRSASDGADWSVTPIKVSDRAIGYIHVDLRGGPLRDEDQVAIDHAATMSALAFLKDDAVTESRRRLSNCFLSGLLEGTVNDDGLVRDMTRDLGWDTSGSFAVMVLEVCAKRSSTAASARDRDTCKGLIQLAMDYTRRAVPGVLFLDRECMLISFLPVRSHAAQGLLGPKAAASLGEHLKRELAAASAVTAEQSGNGISFSIGLGRVKDCIGDMPASFNEAITALRLGRAIRGENLVHNFESANITRLFYDRRTDHDILRFRDEILAGLNALNDTDRDVLMHSVHTYFECGRNVARAAARLVVHPNTLRYRLAKLESLCGLDLNEPEDQLGLQIALRIDSIARA